MARAKTGERVTVAFGKVSAGKKGKDKQKSISMPEETAKVFGLKSVQATVTDKKGVKRRVQGEKGGAHIKVPIGAKVKGKQKYRQIPVPAAATLTEINAFVKTLKSKPKHFISPNGRKYSVV